MVERERPSDADPLRLARSQMPVVDSLAAAGADSRPFAGHTVAVASHLEPTTGVFVEAVADAGADVLATTSNPFSVHGDVVAHLESRDSISVFAWEGMDHGDLDAAQHELLSRGPDLICSDGAELLVKAHRDHPEILDGVIGGAEQTTSGVSRLEAMANDDVLAVPAYGVNHTPMKRRFDNVHGTGESALTNVALSTNTVIAGATIVVAGYGYVGRGIAQKARALGAQTIVTEVNPERAVEAHMHGHRVCPMADAAPHGDLFVTATGNCHVLRDEHLDEMRDGAILCNVGHRDVEIDVDSLVARADARTSLGDGVTRFELPDGRAIHLLAEGELVNLTGPFSQGHPASVMDTTFGSMFVAARHLATADERPAPGLHDLPARLDEEVAQRKLDALGIDIDELTETQRAYLDAWDRERVV